MPETLSEKLSINRKKSMLDGTSVKPVIWGDEVVGYASGDYDKGYNQALDDIDQLSPDVSILARKIKCYCTNTLRVDFSTYGAEKLSKEIINQMGTWIKKG